MKCYKVVLTEESRNYLAQLEIRTRAAIVNKIKLLAIEPEKRGKALKGVLKGLRSIRAAGQRYRIIYHVDNDTVCVIVIAIGIRKHGSKEDIYERLSK